MIRGYNKLLVILILPLLLTACWDYRDVNKRSIDLSIGVDDVNGNLEFTGEIAQLAPNASSKGQSQITGVYKYISLGKYFEGSRVDYDAKMPFPDFSGAVRVVVFSKKYSEKIGIESYINRLNFSNEFRNSVLVVISEEPTNELYSNKVENDISIGYAIENTIRSLSDEGGALYKTVQEIIMDIEFKQIGYLLPYVTKDKNVVKFLGFAVMKNSKLAGIIKVAETNGYLFLLSKQPTMVTTFPHPRNEKNLINTKTSLKNRTIKTTYQDHKINVYIDLKLNTQIQYEYSIQPIGKKDIKKIERIISDKVKKNILSALNRSKDEFQCDVFNFARYFKAQNHEEFKNINWKEEYTLANFHVNVEATLINTNLLDLNAKRPD